MHAHTGNDGVSCLTNCRALHIWPPPLPCVQYRISQGVHPDIPPQSSFQLLPFWISCLFISFQRSSLLSPLGLLCLGCHCTQGSVLHQALAEDQIPYNFSDWKCELSIGGGKGSFKALCWDIEPLALIILHIVELKVESFPMSSKGILDSFWITLCWLNVTFPSELCAIQRNVTKVWEVQTSQNGPQNIFKSFQALPK